MIGSFFLRAKHWQIFLPFFAFFCIAPVALFSSDKPMPPAFIVLAVLAQFCFVAWFWSMGSFLSSVVEPSLRLNVGFFRLALVYPSLYVFALLVFVENLPPALFAVIIPLHLFAGFCMIYVLYFVSKSLALAERGRPVSFASYAGYFFSVWFFPIGVWITQPIINRLYAGRRAGPLTGATSG